MDIRERKTLTLTNHEEAYKRTQYTEKITANKKYEVIFAMQSIKSSVFRE
jgi:hypothetical protein